MDKTVLILLSWSTVTIAWLKMSTESLNQYQAGITIEIKTTNRTKRSITDKNDDPTSLDLVFHLEGDSITLHLERNNRINNNVPIISFENGELQNTAVHDKEITTFYQDKSYASSFAIQRTGDGKIQMIGSFLGQYGWYTLQSKDIDSSLVESGLQEFEIRKDKPIPMSNDEVILRKQINGGDGSETHFPYRRKRAAGSYNVELLMVSDYSVYKYWYDLSPEISPSDKENDALRSIKQYYAFVLNGMDAAYKNIKTSAYTISIVFAGLVISKTKKDSSWTESIKNTSTARVSIESDDGLNNFRAWIQRKSASLPTKDHSMLFTKYDLTRNGSSDVVGLASVGAICGPSSQSIIEDNFEFQVITTTSHELGHSLSAQHDGEGNSCSKSNGFIMASVSSIHKGATATNPWKFSTCSTNYFTTKIDSLESMKDNCLSILDPHYDPTVLAPYDKQLPGQIYDADEQCRHIYGSGSYLCRGMYNGNFTSICNGLSCSDPKNKSYCFTGIPADGTQCGNNKWCKAGVCKYDKQAPSGNEQCLYGDKRGGVFSNGWTCQQMYTTAPNNCERVPIECCKTCEPQLALKNITEPDMLCKEIVGQKSYMCRGIYKGDYTSICANLWCKDTSNPEKCVSITANNRTLCGNKKWCVAGICKSDVNAPVADDQCLYGDYIGPVFSSGKTCAMAYQQNPYICLTNRKPCCQTCSPKTTTKATALSTLPTTSSSTTKVPTMTTTSTTNPTTPTTRKPTTQYTNGITKTTQLRKVTTYNAFQTQFTLPPQIAISTYYKNMIPTAPSSISDNSLPIIAGVGGGLLFLVILVITLCCCCCRGKLPKNKVGDIEKDIEKQKTSGNIGTKKMGLFNS